MAKKETLFRVVERIEVDEHNTFLGFNNECLLDTILNKSELRTYLNRPIPRDLSTLSKLPSSKAMRLEKFDNNTAAVSTYVEITCIN